MVISSVGVVLFVQRQSCKELRYTGVGRPSYERDNGFGCPAGCLLDPRQGLPVANHFSEHPVDALSKSFRQPYDAKYLCQRLETL